MHDSLGAHGDEGLDYLLEDGEYPFGGEALLLSEQLGQISSFAVFHDDAKFFNLTFEVMLINSDKMGM